MKSILLN